MALASIIHSDRFEVGFVPNSDKSANKAQQIIDLNGSYRTRTHDMGGGSNNAQVGNLALLTMLGNSKILTMCGEVTSHNDIRTREEQLKIDMVRAFGSEIAQMGEFIAEVIQSLHSETQLSPEQQDKLFDMVNDIISLKNMMNIGAMPEGQSRLEAMIAQTATKITEILLEGMDNQSLLSAIVDFAHGMLVDVSQKYDIPALNEAIIKIEGRKNTESYLANSAIEMIAQLNDILETQELSEEAQEEIEATIEQLETTIENGEPIPREVIQALEALSENYPDIVISQDFNTSLETLKDANIVVTANALGISVEQMQTIESTIEALNAQLQSGEHNKIIKAEIDATVEKTSVIEGTTAKISSPIPPAFGFGLGGGSLRVTTPPANTPTKPTMSKSNTPQKIGNSPAAPSQPKSPSTNQKPTIVPSPKLPKDGAKPVPDNKPPVDGVKPKDKASNPEKGKETELQKNHPPTENEKIESAKPNKPCGPGQCTCDFGKAANNGDGTVDLELVKGQKVTVTAIEADKLIEKHIKENVAIGSDSWKDTLDQFNGDKVQAFKYLADQNRQEADFSKKYVDTTIDYDAQKNVDTIAQKMKGLDQGAKPRKNDKVPSAKDPFHKCGPGCNHGKTPSGSSSNAPEIDVGALPKQGNSSKPKKTKKIKAYTPK